MDTQNGQWMSGKTILAYGPPSTGKSTFITNCTGNEVCYLQQPILSPFPTIYTTNESPDNKVRGLFELVIRFYIDDAGCYYSVINPE